jgi:soluble lytic murein transglycosylase-like protein
MTQQSPLIGNAESVRSTPVTRRRRVSVRGMIVQGAVAALALVGGISVSQLGGKPDQRTVAEALASRTVSPVAPFHRVTVDASVAQVAERFRKQGYDVTPELAATIAHAAERHGIQREVAFGLVRTESGFRNHATSHVGAIGLSQLMPRTAAWLKPGTTVRELRDPAKNVDIGFSYLRKLIDRYDGDVEMALLAYNRGPGTVDRIVKKGGDPDNGYAAAVLRGAKHGG